MRHDIEVIELKRRTASADMRTDHGLCVSTSGRSGASKNFATVDLPSSVFAQCSCQSRAGRSTRTTGRRVGGAWRGMLGGLSGRCGQDLGGCAGAWESWCGWVCMYSEVVSRRRRGFRVCTYTYTYATASFAPSSPRPPKRTQLAE